MRLGDRLPNLRKWIVVLLLTWCHIIVQDLGIAYDRLVGLAIVIEMRKDLGRARRAKATWGCQYALSFACDIVRLSDCIHGS
jgi:hypothetical protein